jgi:hypothetical protein
MAYDHSDKIGNQGDLVKHSALASVIEYLTQDISKAQRFVYAESHTGRAEYVLPKRGAWKQGIGTFSSSEKMIADRSLPNRQYPALRPYDNACLGKPLSIGMKYPGSSGLAFQMLQAQNVNFEFLLYETNPLVFVDLIRYYHPWQNVQIFQEDGYKGLAGLVKADLVLIDPPKLDQPEQIRELCVQLEKKAVPFICWVPRIGNSGAPADSGQERTAPTEGQNYIKLHDACLRQNLHIFPVRWDTWRSQTCGCYLVVSQGITEPVRKTISQLCKVMKKNWTED